MFYLWMPLYPLSVLLMLPGYFLWGKGECMMWFILQNNCAAEIIIQIWLRNLFTLLTRSVGKTNQGTHVLDESCMQVHATTPKGWGTDTQGKCSTLSQTLTNPCNDISRQHNLNRLWAISNKRRDCTKQMSSGSPM